MKKFNLTPLLFLKLSVCLVALPLFSKKCEALHFSRYLGITEVNDAQSKPAKEKPLVTLYYAAYCPFSQEVLAYLRSIQKKIPMKDVKKDPQAKEELKNLGGLLEVPCLIIDGKNALYSSETIIRWLSEHREELEPL